MTNSDTLQLLIRVNIKWYDIMNDYKTNKTPAYPLYGYQALQHNQVLQFGPDTATPKRKYY